MLSESSLFIMLVNGLDILANWVGYISVEAEQAELTMASAETFSLPCSVFWAACSLQSNDMSNIRSFSLS